MKRRDAIKLLGAGAAAAAVGAVAVPPPAEGKELFYRPIDMHECDIVDGENAIVGRGQIDASGPSIVIRWQPI